MTTIRRGCCVRCVVVVRTEELEASSNVENDGDVPAESVRA